MNFTAACKFRPLQLAIWSAKLISWKKKSASMLVCVEFEPTVEPVFPFNCNAYHWPISCGAFKVSQSTCMQHEDGTHCCPCRTWMKWELNCTFFLHESTLKAKNMLPTQSQMPIGESIPFNALTCKFTPPFMWLICFALEKWFSKWNEWTKVLLLEIH